MSAFYPLTIATINRETKDCVSVEFDVQEAIKEKFKYLPGQYLTLKLPIDGAEIRRSYSICSSDLLNEKLAVAVKKVKLGKGSGYINDTLKVGDRLEVMTPMGNFHSPMTSSNKKTYVLFAGGSGITPMMSILKSVLQIEPESKIILFYGNEDEASIIFKRQLDQIAAKFKERFKVVYILNKTESEQPHENIGIMNLEKNTYLLNKWVDLSGDNEYFICGPTGMMDSAVAALKEKKVDSTRIHVEYFSAPVLEEEKVSELTLVESEATIICDGDEITVKLKAGETILEAALAAGLDAPYACQGGSCCTCRAKLTEGKVHMKVNYALLEKEVEEGFILTCQSQALSSKLVVDYDRGR
ncbi:MAG TPA: FAD-binding oxidoreductase [Bacteroidia bacterium]|nr:FAD-binding oxidoreductase [Bacteroidia bacterium]